MRITSGNEKCPNCGSLLVQNPGKRGKMFCDATCRSNYWQKQQRLAKKEADGFNGEPILSIELPPLKDKIKLKDLTKPTGKKVVSDPPPKTNVTINTMPVKMKGENAVDFGARKNEWKRKQK